MGMPLYLSEGWHQVKTSLAELDLEYSPENVYDIGTGLGGGFHIIYGSLRGVVGNGTDSAYTDNSPVDDLAACMRDSVDLKHTWIGSKHDGLPIVSFVTVPTPRMVQYILEPLEPVRPYARANLDYPAFIHFDDEMSRRARLGRIVALASTLYHAPLVPAYLQSDL